MQFTSERRLDDGVLVEREFTLGEIPGILWTPASVSAPAPLILLGQPGGRGLRKMYPRLAARARHAAADGFASVAIELPESGDRPRSVAAEISGPVGYSGGVISIGVRLAVVEPRISAAVLFAGSFVPRAIIEEARKVSIPLHVLLQWDDEGNDRQTALDLFDAFGSTEKTLTPIWAGTPAPRSSRGTPRPDSSPGT
jgi:hypothetical protein